MCNPGLCVVRAVVCYQTTTTGPIPLVLFGVLATNACLNSCLYIFTATCPRTSEGAHRLQFPILQLIPAVVHTVKDVFPSGGGICFSLSVCCMSVKLADWVSGGFLGAFWGPTGTGVCRPAHRSIKTSAILAGTEKAAFGPAGVRKASDSLGAYLTWQGPACTFIKQVTSCHFGPFSPKHGSLRTSSVIQMYILMLSAGPSCCWSSALDAFLFLTGS